MITLKKAKELHRKGDLSLLSDRELTTALWLIQQESAATEEAAA